MATGNINIKFNGDSTNLTSTLKMLTNTLTVFNSTLSRLPNISRANKSAFQDTVNGLNSLTKALDNTKQSADRAQKSFDFNKLRSVAIEMYLLRSAVNFVSREFSGLAVKILEASENFKMFSAQNAALITSLSGSKDIVKTFKDAATYSDAVQEKFIEINKSTIGSLFQMNLINRELVKQGVYLDINNKKQVTAFVTLSNAIGVLSAGMQNVNAQYAQEIRSLMEGNARQGSTLALFLKKQLGDTWNDIIQDWIRAGTFLENIQKYLIGFDAASKTFEKTWSVVASTFQTLFETIVRKSTGGLYDSVIQSFSNLNDYISNNMTKISEKIKKEFEGIASFIKNINWEATLNVLVASMDGLMESIKTIGVILGTSFVIKNIAGFISIMQKVIPLLREGAILRAAMELGPIATASALATIGLVFAFTTTKAYNNQVIDQERQKYIKSIADNASIQVMLDKYRIGPQDLNNSDKLKELQRRYEGDKDLYDAIQYRLDQQQKSVPIKIKVPSRPTIDTSDSVEKRSAYKIAVDKIFEMERDLQDDGMTLNAQWYLNRYKEIETNKVKMTMAEQRENTKKINKYTKELLLEQFKERMKYLTDFKKLGIPGLTQTFDPTMPLSTPLDSESYKPEGKYESSQSFLEMAGFNLETFQNFFDTIGLMMASFAEQMSSAWTPIIGDWIKGLTTFDIFFRDLMSSILELFFQTITKMIANEAVKMFISMFIPGFGIGAKFGMLPFADGTEYIPRDMPAIVHKGEAIVPRTMNEAIMSGRAVYGKNGVDSGLLATLVNKVDSLANRPIYNIFDFGDEQLKVFNKNSNRVQYAMGVNG